MDYKYYVVNRIISRILSILYFGFSFIIIGDFINEGLTLIFGRSEVMTCEACVGPLLFVYGITLFVVFDFGLFISHHLHHRVPILWEFHKAHHSEKTFHTHVFSIYKELKLKKTLRINKKLIEHNKTRLDAELKYLNDLLKGSNYLAGRFSLADIAFMPRVLILQYLDIKINNKYKFVLGWVENLKKRDSSKIVLEGNDR